MFGLAPTPALDGAKGRLAIMLVAAAALGSVACHDDVDTGAHQPTVGMSPLAYDRWRQPDRIVAALDLEPGDTVADVGAGRGYLTFRIADAVGPSGAVVATDIDPAAVSEIARRLAGGHSGATIDARVVAPDDPGLERGRYQRVLLAQVDHLLPHPTAYLRALRPALAPGGLLAVSNRLTHRARLLAAATAAGYATVSEMRDIPGQYLVLLQPN